MKLQLVLVSLVAIIVVVACCAAAEDRDSSSEAAGKLVKHKLFDFGRFKSMFKKSYSSLSEELVRSKIFFANALRAFLSLVGYKHYKSGMYLKIHDMSDWTNEELRSLEGRNSDEAAESSVVTSQQQQADLGEIEKELKKVIENKEKNEAYAKIANELKSTSNSRRKRDTSGNKRDSLTLDDLFHDPIKPNEAIVGERVPSNNVDYEPPELTSFGTEDTYSNTGNSMSWKFVGLPGSNLIGNMFNGVASVISGAAQGITGGKVVIKKSSKPDEVFVDHRTTNCLSYVKHQGQCGSCFIFSTTALYEWQYCKESGHKVSFSEQYPIDCGDRMGITGCSGGNEREVSKFFGYFGIELRMNYPYRQHVDSCPYSRKTPLKKMGYLKVKGDRLKYVSRSEMDKQVMNTPIVMGLGVSDQFHHYGGGVDLGETCDRRRGHSMLIIGAGREDGIEYWLMRNSYGPHWGDEGHYKIAKDATHCFLDYYTGGILDLKQGSVFEDHMNNNYDNKPVADHFVNYKPTQPVHHHHVFNSDIATPAPF